jgi:hypothetical protein
MTAVVGNRRFELRVLPSRDGGYAIGLYQSGGGGARNGEFEFLVRLHGDPLRSAMEPVLSALKRSGYRATDLRPTRTEPFRLSEEDGVRVGLLFLALRPLRKAARMEAVAENIRAMANEELYYWFSKATASHHGRRGQRALRILIAEE